MLICCIFWRFIVRSYAMHTRRYASSRHRLFAGTCTLCIAEPVCHSTHLCDGNLWKKKKESSSVALEHQRETNRDKPGTIEIRSSSAYLAPSLPSRVEREKSLNLQIVFSVDIFPALFFSLFPLYSAAMLGFFPLGLFFSSSSLF